MTDTSNPPGEKRLRQLGPLHDLLLRASGFDEAGFQSIAHLATQIGYTPQGLYNIIRKKRIAPLAAAKIVEASQNERERLDKLEAKGGGRREYVPVTLEDFVPYIFQ